MFCFEVGGGRMSFTGIFSKSMTGIKSLLVVDGIVGACVVIVCSSCVFPARQVQELSAGVVITDAEARCRTIYTHKGGCVMLKNASCSNVSC